MTGPAAPAREGVRTIADLARLAGVSTGTVSRALAGSPLVRADTRARIVDLARDHGFTPNATARNLRTRRSGAVAVVAAPCRDGRRSLDDPSALALIAHLADALAERGFDLLLSRATGGDGDWLHRIVDGGRADGVIVIGEAAGIEEVAGRYLPMVVWGGPQDGQIHCSVGSDDRAAGRLATQRLIDQGCRQIGYIGTARTGDGAQRLTGCVEALAVAGVTGQPQILTLDGTDDAAAATILGWLGAHGSDLDGIVCASDGIAMMVLRGLAALGRRVPGDVRVIGHGDQPFASQTIPALTSVRPDLAAGARQLVDALVRRMAGTASASVTIPLEVIVRDSG